MIHSHYKSKNEMYVTPKQLCFKNLRRDEEAPIFQQGRYTRSGHFNPLNAEFKNTTAQNGDPKELTKHVKSLTPEGSDGYGKYDSDLFDVLTMADRMLQYAFIIRPSAHERLQLPCLNSATAAPSAI